MFLTTYTTIHCQVSIQKTDTNRENLSVCTCFVKDVINVQLGSALNFYDEHHLDSKDGTACIEVNNHDRHEKYLWCFCANEVLIVHVICSFEDC